MKPPAFQFYADDFLAGVADMTQAEVGAYILLLSHQWSRGAVPSDPARAGLIAKGEVSPHVMAKFPNGQNQRLEHERQKQADYRQQQSSKGKASAQARFNRGSTVVQPEGQPEGNSPSPSPSPNRNTIDHFVIDAIWEAYPRKVGKKKAYGIITSLLKKGRTDLLEKVKAYAAAVSAWPAGDEIYIPHPSTWFARGSYDDPPETWKRLPTNKPAARTTPDRINFKTDDYTNLET